MSKMDMKKSKVALQCPHVTEADQGTLPARRSRRGMTQVAMTELNLSARAYDRILKAYRRIADLAGSEPMQAEQATEAIQYRTVDRSMWS